jgi:hypothetical protein
MILMRLPPPCLTCPRYARLVIVLPFVQPWRIFRLFCGVSKPNGGFLIGYFPTSKRLLTMLGKPNGIVWTDYGIRVPAYRSILVGQDRGIAYRLTLFAHAKCQYQRQCSVMGTRIGEHRWAQNVLVNKLASLHLDESLFVSIRVLSLTVKTCNTTSPFFDVQARPSFKQTPRHLLSAGTSLITGTCRTERLCSAAKESCSLVIPPIILADTY